MKIIIVYFTCIFTFSYAYGQELPIDTVSVSMCQAKKGYYFGSKKMVILLPNGEKIKDQIKAHDYLIICLDPPKQGYLFLKIYKRNGELFALGKWNETGFLEIVDYYRKGVLKRKAIFDQGSFIKYRWFYIKVAATERRID